MPPMQDRAYIEVIKVKQEARKTGAKKYQVQEFDC